MSEQRLIDANEIKFIEYINGSVNVEKEVIDRQPTIDPETLPIVQELREKLFRYEQAEQEGRLVELPCKVGQQIFSVFNREITKRKVLSFEFAESKITVKTERWRLVGTYGLSQRIEAWFEIKDFGKTVFLTREEAEAALKER